MNKNLKPVIAVAGASLAFSIIFTGLVSCDNTSSGDDESTTLPSIHNTSEPDGTTADPSNSTDDVTTEDPNAYTEVNETVYVTVAQVNIRSEAKVTATNVVGTGFYGNSFTRVKYSDNWSVVLYDGEEAYISSDCLSTTDPTKVTLEFDPIDRTVYVTTEKLNLREQPNSDGIIHAIATKDQALVAIGISKDSKWYKINYNETIVYASADCLDDRLVGSDFTAVDKKVQITVDTLNVRKAPSTAGEVVGVVVKNAVVTVVGVSPDGNWYKIKYTPAGGSEDEYYMSAGSNYSKPVDESVTEGETTTAGK